MIIETLNKIQTSLKAPKGQYNDFGKYSYRSCEDILEAVKPLLEEHKAVIRLSDEVLLIGDRYYIKATATIHCGDESISATALAREEETKKGMDASQISGTASSYARKYALNGLLAIDDTADSDKNNKGGGSKGKGANTKKATCDECGKAIAPNNGKSPEWIANWTKQQYGRPLCVECYKKARISKAKTSDAALELSNELKEGE